MQLSPRAAWLALTISVFAASGAYAQGPGVKLGYIDSRIILQQAPGRAEMDTQLQKEIAPWQNRLKAMSDSNNALVAAYQKDQATLTPALRTAREENIIKKREAWQNEAQQLEEKMQDAQERIALPLMQMFNDVLKEIRAEDNYTMIFDIGSGQQQFLVAADKNLDLTDKVLARLKTVAATKRPTAAAPAAKPLLGPVTGGSAPVKPATNTPPPPTGSAPPPTTNTPPPTSTSPPPPAR